MRATDDLSVDELINRCREESDRFRKVCSEDYDSCFELFRRAIVTQDQAAWGAIYQQYRHEVAHWIYDYRDSEDVLEERINLVFERFWRSMDSQTFISKFSSIERVIGYLKMCARSVRIDEYRREARYAFIKSLENEENEAPISENQPAVEQTIIHHVSQEELFERIHAVVKDEMERRVIHYSFRLGMTPRQIVQEFPQQFSSVEEVRRVKERVLLRLSNEPRLQAWWRSINGLGKNY